MAKQKLVDSIQRLVQSYPTDPTLCLEAAKAAKEYGDLRRATESFLRKKSGYMQVTKIRHISSRPCGIIMLRAKVFPEGGSRMDSPGEIKEEVVLYFQRLLSASPSGPIDHDILSKAPQKTKSSIGSYYTLRLGVPHP